MAAPAPASHLPGGSVFYHWREGRDQGGITDVLGDESVPRILQCDGYSAYPAWAKPTSGSWAAMPT